MGHRPGESHGWELPWAVTPVQSLSVTVAIRPAQLNYADMLKRVEPLRNELQKLEDDARDNQQKANEVEQMIRDLEASIARYKEEYAVLISEAQAIKADLAAVEAKVSFPTGLVASAPHPHPPNASLWWPRATLAGLSRWTGIVTVTGARVPRSRRASSVKSEGVLMAVLRVTEWRLGRDHQGNPKPVSLLPGGQLYTCLFSGLDFISGITEGLLVRVSHPLPPSLMPALLSAALRLSGPCHQHLPLQAACSPCSSFLPHLCTRLTPDGILRLVTGRVWPGPHLLRGCEQLEQDSLSGTPRPRAPRGGTGLLVYL